MTRKDIIERIRLVTDGVPLKLDNLTIRTTSSGKLLITGWTNTINFENITKSKILQELDNLKKSYSELAKSFEELNDIVKNNGLTMLKENKRLPTHATSNLGIWLNGKISLYLEDLANPKDNADLAPNCL